MQIYSLIADLRQALRGQARIAFVPTMGNLHEGHISLMRQARLHADFVVSSIFVNRLQFGAGEDFDRYPRTFKDDCDKLEAAGVDVLFAPTEADLYPEPQTYHVDPPEIQSILEGAVRPGHFRGVATVVLKLFNCVQPHVALFGQKDYQQLLVLRNMTRQMALPIEIIGGKTVRTQDGLALSSRNGYLSPQERQEAPRLYRVISTLRDQICAGDENFTKLENWAVKTLDDSGWKTDYVAVRQRSDLLPPTVKGAPLVIVAASRLGATRLIDNIEV